MSNLLWVYTVKDAIIMNRLMLPLHDAGIQLLVYSLAD